jgi:uncharacterized protein with HEPN domain
VTGVALYLRHILDATDRILEYTVEGRDDFLATPMAQDATIRNLEIIGEAAKQVSADYRGAHPEVPWSRLAGMRDVLIHGYMGVDLQIVWDVVANRLPELRSKLAELLSGEES